MSQRFLSALLTVAAVTGAVGAMPEASHADEAADSPAFTIAQTTSENTGSLSVTGTSQVNAPADQAVILLTYYANTYYGDYSADSSTTPQSPQVLPSDIQAATNALTAAGVPASNIKAYPDFTSPGSMRVRFTVDQPTQARVEQLISSVNMAVMKDNRYSSSGAVVGYTVRDCQSIENQARQSAMNDAQNRATALSSVVGRQLGEVYSVSESVSWGSNYTTTCPSSTDPSVYSDIYSLPTYDPTIPAIVKIVYSLNITYDMK